MALVFGVILLSSMFANLNLEPESSIKLEDLLETMVGLVEVGEMQVKLL